MQPDTSPPNTTEPDYKELYLQLLRTQDQAIRMLQNAHIKAEETYINQTEPENP